MLWQIRPGVFLPDATAANYCGYSRPLIVNNNDPKNFFLHDPATSFGGSTKAAWQQLGRACQQGNVTVGYDTMRGNAFFQMDARIPRTLDPAKAGRYS